MTTLSFPTRDRYIRSLTGLQLTEWMEETLKAAEFIELCYFVLAAANGWSVLQKMCRCRLNMLVVVGCRRPDLARGHHGGSGSWYVWFWGLTPDEVPLSLYEKGDQYLVVLAI